MSSLIHRKNAHKSDPENAGDVEKGKPGSDPAAKGGEKAPDYDTGDEYEILLRYVDVESKKVKSNKDDNEDADAKWVRPWYAPWKKVKKSGSNADRKVPEEWLNTNMQSGLSGGEVDKRREGFGYNELTSAKENQFKKIVGYFRGPILYIMELAVLLAAGLRDWIDFGVIIGILVLNAGVGWYQEKQAGDIVEQLKAGIALKATVVRDGKEDEIEARELVIGDIVVLDEGSTIPADARIIADYKDKDGSKAKVQLDKNAAAKKKKDAGHHDDGDDDDDDQEDSKGPSVASVDQSAITGESLAQDKFLGNTAYYTCGLKRGKVYGIVIAPARQSFVGKTAMLVQNSNDVGHFQIVLGGIGTALLVMVFVFLVGVWIAGFFHNVSIATPEQNNLLVYTLIFLIIGVPVGLPCVTTTTLAVGAAYLARQKAIVQKLTAIESLAGVDVLCSDKTGTLTANKLSLNEPYLAPGIDADWFMTVAVLASSHNVKRWVMSPRVASSRPTCSADVCIDRRPGHLPNFITFARQPRDSLDPIDKVTIVALKDYPKARESLKSGWHTSNFSPFNPVTKYITAEVEKDGKKYTCCKGAPNSVLKLKAFDPETVKKYRATSLDFAKRGFRSLGVAVKEEGKDWELLGIMSMLDPPRGDTRKTIGEAMALGISIKMLTGDAAAIAKETCRALGIGQNIFDSQQLLSGGMEGSDIRDFVEHADGFAEVFPEHKYQVVELLQQRGHLVAMTGDGVNDAPSLKKADCGIAVEGASDAARTAADVVFLDEGLSTIITAIKQSRKIFHRMKAYIIYRIALCIHLEVYLLLSIAISNEVIRVDLIVFLAIFADLATIAIAYDACDFGVRPVEWQLPKIWIVSTIIGLLLAGGTWIVRGSLFLHNGGLIENFGVTQEILFLEVALTESWVILITRLPQGKGDGAAKWPSIQLCLAILGVDILASLFTIFGWLSGAVSGHRQTSIVTVVEIWLYSFGVTVVIACVYAILNQIPWLNNLGRQKAPKTDKRMENLLSNIQRMTLSYEPGTDGEGTFRFNAPAAAGAAQAPHEQRKKQDDTAKKGGAEGGNSDKAAKDQAKQSGATDKDVPADKATKSGAETPAERGDDADDRSSEATKAENASDRNHDVSPARDTNGGRSQPQSRSQSAAPTPVGDRQRPQGGVVNAPTHESAYRRPGQGDSESGLAGALGQPLK